MRRFLRREKQELKRRARAARKEAKREARRREREAQRRAQEARERAERLRLHRIRQGDERAARGEGLDERLTIAGLRPEQLSWALVTFRQKEDAEALVKGEGEAVAAPLVKRAIAAAQAWQDMAEDARRKQEEQDRTVLAVSRIQSWLKRLLAKVNSIPF